MSKRKVSRLAILRIVAEYESGRLTQEQIARKHNVSASCVCTVLRGMGCVTRNYDHRQDKVVFSGDGLAALVDEYKSGMSMYELAEKYSTSQTTVSRAIHRSGCVARKGKIPGQAPRMKTPDRLKWLNIKSRYGLDQSAFRDMLASQGGKCAICGVRIPSAPGPNCHIDHDHNTGSVRGLLCRACNHGLGNFRDDIQRFEAAVRYLGCASQQKDAFVAITQTGTDFHHHSR